MTDRWEPARKLMRGEITPEEYRATEPSYKVDYAAAMKELAERKRGGVELSTDLVFRPCEKCRLPVMYRLIKGEWVKNPDHLCRLEGVIDTLLGRVSELERKVAAKENDTRE